MQKNSVNSHVKETEPGEDSNLMTFDRLVLKINEDLNKQYDDSKMSDADMAKRQELEHQGTLGITKAESLLISEIETILREENLLGVKYPAFYESLAHAVFQEIYRFGVFYKWETFPESPSAMIVGKEIWFKIDGKFVKQKEELRENQIEEIIRLLQIGNSHFKVNEANPEDEIYLDTGVRIKVMIPPLAGQPTIAFRRFVVNTFSFEKQASFETIPTEDIPFYRALSKLYLNTIIAGGVESGKSTLLKTIYSARDKDKVAVLIESSAESYLKRDFPERLVHELYTDKSGNIHDIMRSVLRIDHDYVIVQEVRGVEAEGAIAATERGTRGTLMTYHITDPVKTPEQLAQHITDQFPNRKTVNEIRRIALQLDIGITMATFSGNKKKVTSIYEMCYDFESDKAWINYLVRFNPKTGEWQYNPNVSKMLKDKMDAYNASLTDLILNHLQERSKKYPIDGDTKQYIHFKE